MLRSRKGVRIAPGGPGHAIHEIRSLGGRCRDGGGRRRKEETERPRDHRALQELRARLRWRQHRGDASASHGDPWRHRDRALPRDPRGNGGSAQRRKRFRRRGLGRDGPEGDQDDYAGWTGVAPLILYSARDREVVTRVGAGTTPARATLEHFRRYGKTDINTALIPADIDVWLPAPDPSGA